MQKRSTRRRPRIDNRLLQAETPICVLDARRTVLLFNAGFEQLTSRRADEIVGTVCDYLSDADPAEIESVSSCLCPPAEVFNGRTAAVPTHFVGSDGEMQVRLVHFVPIMEAEGRVGMVIGVAGALEKPAQVAQAGPAQQLHAELAALRHSLRQRFGLKSLICQSDVMRRILHQFEMAAATSAAVCLVGEAGTGKEHVARTIHSESAVGERAFVPLDCKALPAFELKQTLKRMFEIDMSAASAEDPLFAGLQTGTIYLNPGECIPRDVQSLIVEAFGSRSDSSPTKLRLMSSSSDDLNAAVERDEVQPEFYYLLTPLVIELPPLRQRIDDLELLSQDLLEQLNRGDSRQIAGFSDDVWLQFREYNWPGNLDELSAVVVEARERCQEELIRAHDLPFRFRTGREAQSVGPKITPDNVPLEKLLERVEKEEILRILESCRYNRSKAAGLLGITRQRLYRRMEALGIEDHEENNDPHKA